MVILSLDEMTKKTFFGGKGALPQELENQLKF
jgi:hypothetical protein